MNNLKLLEIERVASTQALQSPESTGIKEAWRKLMLAAREVRIITGSLEFLNPKEVEKSPEEVENLKEAILNCIVFH